MSWESLTTTGRGRARYRLMIEGWPEEWVTDASITHASGADGRSVYTGLSYPDGRIRDRIIMQEARIEADGITFQVKPTDSHERPLASFANYPEPIAMLRATLSESDTSLSGGKLNNGASLSDDTYYYLGSETIKVTTFPTIQRARWGSFACIYNIGTGTDPRATYLYPRPVTMEGRRAYLYAYGDGDDLAGDGVIIWRGIVRRPPKLAQDGLTWLIEAGPITDLLRQNIAGKIGEAHIVGIYHHSSAAFAFNLATGRDLSTVGVVQHFCGITNERQLVDAINPMLVAAVADLGMSSSIPYIELRRGSDNRWRISVRPTSDVDFAFYGGSPILGTAKSPNDGWVDSSGNARPGVSPASLADSAMRLLANKDYDLILSADNPEYVSTKGLFSYDGPVACPLGYASSAIMLPDKKNLFPNGGSRFYDADSEFAFPAWRVFVDTDMTDVRAIYIAGTLKADGFFKVVNSGKHTDGDGIVRNYMDIEPYFGSGPHAGDTKEQYDKALAVKRGFSGFLNSSSTIDAVRDYIDVTQRPSRSGSVADFVYALKQHQIYSNDGDTPQITDQDLSAWVLDDSVVWAAQLDRTYRFAKPKALEDVLREECKFVCHFMRIALDGRIELQPLPSITAGTVPDARHTIDASGIITPYGNNGSWPGWEPQIDGLISMVEIAQAYMPDTDEWADTPMVYADPNAIATHKSRGKVQMSIKPFSRPSVLNGSEVDDTGEIANQYLNLFGRDYNVITLSVSFKHFYVMCGDVVRVTHRLIPNGAGGRGIDRNGIVIERSWPLDPASAAYGELTILVYAGAVRGYAPEALITVQSNAGGNTWNLTCDVALPENIAISPNGDGQILQYFGDSAFIQIVQLDTPTPTKRTGRIVGTPNGAAGTCQVLLDSSWTPGASGWKLSTQPDADGAHSTDFQKRTVVYVADRNLVHGDGSFAGKFS